MTAAEPGGDPPVQVLELLALASAQPGEAMARARRLLAGAPAPYEASVARQTIGLLLREFGDLDAAIGELRAALRLARSAGSAGRQADVLATLAVALIYRGRSGQGLAAFERSLALATGPAAGQVLHRRGTALLILGRHREALADLSRAVRVLRAAGDTVWEARALNARALVHLACGATGRADADLSRAERLYATTRQELEAAFIWHTRGRFAFRSGDVPRALSCLDEAGRRYARLEVPSPDLSIDRCAVLLAAGLAQDALREADAAVRGFTGGGGPQMQANLLLSAARAALAAGQPQAAMAHADAARRMYAAQHRAWWQAHASLLHLQARFAAWPPSGRLLRQAEQAALSLTGLGAADAQQARLLAGRVAAALGRGQEADRHFAVAARARHRRVAALTRAQGWLAEALRAEAAGHRRRLLGACRHGLAVLDEHLLTLGASELRAQAAAQGTELAALAQRAALASGRARQLLVWSERWRASALAVPAARPVDDAALQADLTALRDVTSRLERAGAGGNPTTGLRREQLRLEGTVRRHVLQARGGGDRDPDGGYRFDAGALLDRLGETRLVQIVDIDGRLHLLVCGAGRVRHLAGGRTDDAAREVDFARFSLRRLAHGRGAGVTGALALLGAAGARLEAALLGPAAARLGNGPVVVVPPGRLHAVPWALLPTLRDQAVSVAPSARAWLQARAAAAPRGTGVVLVRGPGLGAGGGELPALAAGYPGATVLAGGTATARRVLAALDGAQLAHIAAHGTFRADSPLFSSLRMDDGPLTVHDLEGLRRAPYRVVLSSCDSGVLGTAGANDLLGLASSLIPLGTAGLVASVVPVNDQATAGLMVDLHRRLRGGATLAGALCEARSGVGGDPVRAATAWSFVALGAR